MTKSTVLAALLVLATGFATGSAFAEETMGEKAAATGNDVSAAGEKGVNRVKEAVCMEGDAKCLAKKAGHRVEETGTKVKNGAKKAKNKVD